MKNNFDIVLNKSFPEKYSSADGKILHWIENIFGIGTGRRKACKESGLTGAEKRYCAKQLKKSGWKKGDAIPESMAGIKPEDVPSGYVPPSSYVPLPDEVYVSPYTQDTTYQDTQTGINQPLPYPRNPDLPNLNNPSRDGAWKSMSQGEKTWTVVGVSAATLVFGFLIGRAIKRKSISTK